MPLLAAGLDIATLSASFGEALPQAIGEAMACGIPCVATDVGDIALLIGDAGIVVPAQKPHELANAWQSILELSVVEYDQLCDLSRDRILELYISTNMINEYKTIYRELKKTSHQTVSQ